MGKRGFTRQIRSSFLFLSSRFSPSYILIKMVSVFWQAKTKWMKNTHRCRTRERDRGRSYTLFCWAVHGYLAPSLMALWSSEGWFSYGFDGTCFLIPRNLSARIEPPAGPGSGRGEARRSFVFGEMSGPIANILEPASKGWLSKLEVGFWKRGSEKKVPRMRAPRSTQYDVKCGFPFQNFEGSYFPETWAHSSTRKLTWSVVKPGVLVHETIKVIPSQQVT